MADHVCRRGKRKTTQFRVILVWIIIFYFKNYSNHNAFYNKRLHALFKDQLDRSKATCSFKQKILLNNYDNSLLRKHEQDTITNDACDMVVWLVTLFW